MRTELKRIGNDKRYTFTATFVREGTKRGWQGAEEETILLKNIKLKETGKQICDHIWFTKGSQWYEEDWEAGDIVEFCARAGEYEKGWKGRKAEMYGEERHEQDWRLERPTKIKKVNQNNQTLVNQDITQGVTQ